jgi:hypothetical protein
MEVGKHKLMAVWSSTVRRYLNDSGKAAPQSWHAADIWLLGYETP